MRASTLSLGVIAKLVLAWLVWNHSGEANARPVAVKDALQPEERILPYGSLRLALTKDTTSATQYTPPDTCREACADLLTALGKCEDDSCICSQNGFDAFFQ